MQFKILKKSKKSQARLGVIKTKNGILHTPAFFPVATQACLKTLDSEDIQKIGFENVLCNTYHLMLRPGSALIKKMGGLHKFMNLPTTVIATDSGGFQVFSLGTGLEHGVGKLLKIFPGHKKSSKISKPALTKIQEEGVHFRSYLDGSEHFLSPEKSIKLQEDLGADIIFAFDECTSPLDSFEYTKKAMERTHRWAERCLKARKKKDQALFGIIQGGWYKRLREKSAQFIGSLDFDGFGIGGSLGKTKSKIFEILDWTIPLLPEEKPRHLLGIGYLEDFERSIKRGVDLFDCVYPTRMARHGTALTLNGNLDLRKSKFLHDKTRLDGKCSCSTCQNYTRSYLAHLIRTHEITGSRLLTLHNLCFFKDFINTLRKKIEQGKI